ncbi:hypothetical protein AB0L97_32785 [Nocardia sp. NPDC051911]|uniref:hypothetical protein n=1 Tax=Nocardia sp. NPDC051911 TaxID=3154648 RepID=UPI003415C034
MVGGGVDTNHDLEPLAAEMLAAARRVVRKNAVGETAAEKAADARTLLAMLGLAETADPPSGGCVQCKRRFSVSGEPGTVRHDRAGYCKTCYKVRDVCDLVDPAPARAHLDALHDAGMLWREISAWSGVPLRTLTLVRTTQVRTRADICERILAVPIPDDTGPRKLTCAQCGQIFASHRDIARCQPCIQGLVPAEAATAHIARLRDAGMTLRRITDLADAGRETISNIARGKVRHTRPEIAERILAIPVPVTDPCAQPRDRRSHARAGRIPMKGPSTK